VTFGQVFAAGAVMPGQALVAKINGQDVAVQMDVKTTNADGSVAHAILTLKSPGIAANGDIAGTLSKGSASSSAPVIQAQDILSKGYNFKVDVTLNGSVKTIDAGQLLQQAIAGGNVETWMKGSQASEYRVSANVAPNLDVKFDIRMDADGKTRTDVIFARDDAYTTNTSTLTYGVKFTQNGQTVFSDDNIQQYAYSTWHHDVSSAGSVDPQVVYDMQYLMNTGAVPSYDLSTAVSSSVTAGYMQQLAQADTGPMGSALVQKYMPMTGGREDIGPETGWTSNYISTQNADAAKVMYANADAAGSVPWHFIDTNGDAVRVDQHPNLWIDGRGTTDRYGSDSLPVTYDPSGTGWTPEVAHQPSLSYVPYLLSGDHYYLDELQAQASYTIAAFDPNYRDGGKGAIPDVTQARALGWALRDISNAAYITPDGEALKGYFTNSLNNSLDKLIADYVNGAKGDAEGQLEGWIDGGAANPDWIRPWQQDLLATGLQTAAAKGFDKADTLLGWMDNFLSGRFNNGSNGFDPRYGATYTLDLNKGGQAIQTWGDAFQETFSGNPPAGGGEGAGFDWAGGYAANAKAALAGVISSTQSPDAIEAYGWLQSQTTAMKASYETNPNWNIAPRLANGQYLTNDAIKVQTATTGTTMTAGSGNTMLIGNAGNDTVTGGSGIGLLFGMGGDDTITAKSGNSYLYGGDGNDRLQAAAAGTEATKMTLKGGTGRDVFAFVAGAHATITDFKSSDDRIELSGVNASDVKVSNSGGSTYIDLTNNGRITVAGATLSQSALNISYA
jgi:hypothetical protein